MKRDLASKLLILGVGGWDLGVVPAMIGHGVGEQADAQHPAGARSLSYLFAAVVFLGTTLFVVGYIASF